MYESNVTNVFKNKLNLQVPTLYSKRNPNYVSCYVCSKPTISRQLTVFNLRMTIKIKTMLMGFWFQFLHHFEQLKRGYFSVNWGLNEYIWYYFKQKCS